MDSSYYKRDVKFLAISIIIQKITHDKMILLNILCTFDIFI